MLGQNERVNERLNELRETIATLMLGQNERVNELREAIATLIEDLENNGEVFGSDAARITFLENALNFDDMLNRSQNNENAIVI